MPETIQAAVDKYVAAVNGIAESSLFSAETLARMTLFLESDDRVFLWFHADGVVNARRLTFKPAGTRRLGNVPVPFSRYAQILDLLRNESGRVAMTVEDEEILEFAVTSSLEPAGEGE